MAEAQPQRRVIAVNRPIAGPREPRRTQVIRRKISDYPRVGRPWLDVAQRLSSPLLMGPPICDELIAFVQHVFSEEEASVARHLGLVVGRSALDVARAEHRDMAEVEPLLSRLAFERRVIAASGPPGKHRYRLLPIMPGIFEMVLIDCTPESLSDWHRRFIELFEALYETGYAMDYQGHLPPMVRYLPVGKAVEAHPMALPSDQLEVVLDRFHTFGVGQCQCRLTTQTLGRGCGKPLENCTVIGDWAERGIHDGWLKQVSKQGVLEIKREAESHGLATWMMNVESAHGQCSCSCCGCCCHAMRMVTEFNAPAALAPPHFMPRLDPAKCTYCGKCAKACPMHAIVVSKEAGTCPIAAKPDADHPLAAAGSQDSGLTSAPRSLDSVPSHRHLVERCIGCGLCVLACDSRRALVMEPVPDYKMPYQSWFSLIAHATPGILRTSWNVWRQRG